MIFQLEGFSLLLTISSNPEWSALDFRLLGTVRSPRLHLYHSQLIKKLARANNKVSTLISNRTNFSESKKIKCGSSRGFSQLIKVHECQQDTITSHHETCHTPTPELSEAEPILSGDGNH